MPAPAQVADPAPLPPRALYELFFAMALTRAVEERLEILFKQGHVGGGVYRSLGQEAGPVGIAYALRRRKDGRGDVVGQTIRATGALLLMGGTPLEYFRQYLSRGTGPTRGAEANVHWTDLRRGFVGPISPLGTMMGIMTGITLSFRIRDEDRVGVVFYGDGASSTGAWHEGLSVAAARRCPLIVAVEANQYAFSTPTEKQTRTASFVEKAPMYGIDALSVDGNDVLAVHEAARAAVEGARKGRGVQMIELRTYRRRGHAQHDSQDYVPPEELAAWEARDPIARFRSRVLEEGWCLAPELDRLEEVAGKAAADAASRAVDEPKPEGPAAAGRVYSDRPTPPPWTRVGSLASASTAQRAAAFRIGGAA